MGEESTPGALFSQPDPKLRSWVVGKPDRLERRGPCAFFSVGQTQDGRPAEAPIAPLSFGMRGIQ